MTTESEIKALLDSIANRQIKEYSLGAKRDKEAQETRTDIHAIKGSLHSLYESHHHLAKRVDRTESTATGARQSVSEAQANAAFIEQGMKNHVSTLEGKIGTLETKLDDVASKTAQASQDMGTGARALAAGNGKQQTATRTNILVAVLFALGQLIQLWRGH